jgi:hypothetical protein
MYASGLCGETGLESKQEKGQRRGQEQEDLNVIYAA